MEFTWSLQKWHQRGKPTAEYSERRKSFKVELSKAMRELARRPEHFPIGVREWCYLLEHTGLTKGEFGWAEELITECRKEGLLPLDICADDSNRGAIGLESIDDQTPEACAEHALSVARYVVDTYTPVSFWDGQSHYIELWTEKLSLRNLFEPVCREFMVPVTNAKGWSDLNMRAAAMRRFQEHEKSGRQCVLLYFGDHDPVGIQIADFLKSNMLELEGAIGWRPDKLIIDRFGISQDFIQAHGIGWIENLLTSSGKEADTTKEPAKTYVASFGRRKVEASSVINHVDAARALCRDTILKYIDPARIESYIDELSWHREAANSALIELLKAA